MGYILEFRDEMEKEELLEKLHKAKKAVCDVLDMMEEADGGMHERGRYRGSYRGNMRMREDMEDMDWRNSRYGR